MKTLLGTLMAFTLVGCNAGTQGSSSGPQAVTAPPVAVQSDPVDTHPLYTDRVVLIGDSITFLWNDDSHVEWKDTLAVHLPNMVDAGISGNDTAQMLARFDSDVLSKHPDVVVILGGVNDIKGAGRAPADVAANIFDMVQRAQSAGAKVIVGTVMAGSSTYFPDAVQCGEVDAQIDALNRLLVIGATQYGYTVADYHKPMLSSDGTPNDSLLADGLHPNDAGYAAMWQVLKPLLPVDARAN